MKRLALLLACILLSFKVCMAKAKIDVTDLRVEMKENPLGINSAHPRFSWKIESCDRNVVQLSYQVEVATSKEQLEAGEGLLWNSGMVKSGCSVLVPYAGVPLQAGTEYFWRVKVQTNKGASKWSAISRWTMTMDAASFRAKWIGIDSCTNAKENAGTKEDARTRLAARYLRKEFTLDKPVRRALLYICGLGSSEAYINGKRVGDGVLSPTVSLYTKRVYYNVYDVTDLLSDRNAIGVVLGNGRYFGMRNPGAQTFGFPRLFTQLMIDYTDGSKNCIASDGTWKATAKGPIVANNEYDGEEYDARLEMKGWCENGYDDHAWRSVDVMAAPQGVMDSQPNPNIVVHESVMPVSITKLSSDKYILDMGQNMVGWLTVDLKAKKDSTVTMRFAETLKKDGSLYLDNLRSALVTDKYTAAKDGAFHWEPSFTYHGFRYVEVSGLDYKPELSDFTGKVVYDAMATTGSFETSNVLLNQIYKNSYWGIRGNYRGMPTDCPQRDERMGWLGDRATGAYGEAFVFDNSLLYSKWLQDIEDSMSPQGSISDVSPDYWILYNDDVTWSSAFFNVADMLYKQYGDDSAIRKHYPAMRKWMKHMEEVSLKDGIMTKDVYGDWCMPPEAIELIHSKDPARKTDAAILSTTVYYNLLHKMMKYAHITGNDVDIPGYEALASQMKEAYNNKFFNKETGSYGNNTVTANILSLCLGLVPAGYENKVFDHIVKKTEGDFDGHVSTGVVGIQYLMRGLTNYGNVDLAYKLATNDTYPSWGYMVKNGATTIWELWNGNTADPSMNSGNHVMLLGDLLIWCYEDLAGIKCAPDVTGFKKLIMAPVFPDGLDAVNASYKSAYGDIKSAWTKKDGAFNWNITLPANTSAIVRLPNDLHAVANRKSGLKEVAKSEKYTDFEIGSGSYNIKGEYIGVEMK